MFASRIVHGRGELARRDRDFYENGVEMPQTLHRLTGSGPVGIGRSQLWALWEYNYEDGDDGRPCNRRWIVRVSLDEAEGLGLFPYQWVHLQLPGRRVVRALYQGGKDAPPFMLLTFER
jgi:hypothetical protein